MLSMIGTFLICCLFLSLSGGAYATTSLEESRAIFLQAEKLIRSKKDTEFIQLAEQLKNYPLHPYLQYQWLHRNLKRDKEILMFLVTYPDSRYAHLLRGKWVHHLAEHKDWKRVIKYYHGSGRAQLQCDYYWARYQTGHKHEAIKAAKKLWVVGRSQPENCDPLFHALMKSKDFTRDMLWQRFQSALGKGRVQLAKYVRNLMSKKDSRIADLWINVHRHPQLVIEKKDWHREYSQAGLIFAHAVDRMARVNSVDATEVWDIHKDKYTIPEFRVNQIERKLALGLAFRRDKRAFNRLEKLRLSDETVREWQIRVALEEQNWHRVAQSLDKLNEDERQQVNWQYWLARSYDQSGKHDQASRLFSQLAEDRSFYGFLSAYKLNRNIQINDQPIQVTEKELAKLERNNTIQMVYEFRVIGHLQEAKRLWWYFISTLDTNEILVAAKLAEKWQWNQIAIFTIAKAKYWDDVGLRFPVKYSDQIKLNAKRNELDPAIVFGLIRRESAFNENARSPVGARGLMQIMPKTGRQIARELKEKWRTETSLSNPELNLKYGTFYYKQLLEQFDGHYALAAAAYNAGPHRVKRWLPEQKPMAADIWIETIPFKETRAYVSSVLTYSLIYQQRLQRNVLNIKDFMRDILPD